MSALAFSLISNDEKVGLAARFTPPPFLIDPIVKLRAEYPGGEVPGTGFILQEVGADVILTARHVVARYEELPRPVRVRVYQAGQRWNVAAVGYLSGSGDENDFAVALLLQPATCAKLESAPPVDGAPATLEGYLADAKTRTPAVSLLSLNSARQSFLGYDAVGAGHEGTSGGPIIQQQRAVGVHIREDTALKLLMVTHVLACRDSARSALAKV